MKSLRLLFILTIATLLATTVTKAADDQPKPTEKACGKDKDCKDCAAEKAKDKDSCCDDEKKSDKSDDKPAAKTEDKK